MNLRATNVFLTKTYSIAKVGDVDQAQLMGSTARQQQEAAPSSISAYSAPELILNGLCTEKVNKHLGLPCHHILLHVKVGRAYLLWEAKACA